MNEKRLQDIAVGAITGFLAALLISGEKTPRHQQDHRAGLRPRFSTTDRQDERAQARTPRPGQPQATAPVAFENADEDAVLKALAERLNNGEYVNMFEFPDAWKRRKEAIKENVQILAAINRTNLTPVFTDLGLSESTSELLQQHVSKINEAAMEASSMVMQVEEAREAYDRKMRKLLNPEDYERYRLYESSGEARRTYEKINDFSKQRGSVLPEGDRESIIAVIRDAQAYAEEGYLGPYEKLPTLTVGIEKGLRLKRGDLTAVENGANRALEIAAQRGLSEDAIQVLYDYYKDDVEKRSAEIVRLEDPLIEEKVAADMKRRREEIARAH